MRIRLIRKGEQKEGVWAGGTTTQLAIGPEGADYAARRFDWRISTARVERDESDFTPLPGFRRILMILEGSVHLTHDGVREIDLAVLQEFLPYEAQRRYAAFSHYGYWVLLILMFTGVFGAVITPIVSGILNLYGAILNPVFSWILG